MSHYKSNVRDQVFNLFEVYGLDKVLGEGAYADLDADTATEMLGEIARLAEGPIAESFADADRHPPVFDPHTHTVTLPDSFKKPGGEPGGVESEEQHARSRPPIGRLVGQELGLDARFNLAPDDRCGEAGHALGGRPRPGGGACGDQHTRGAHVEGLCERVHDAHPAPDNAPDGACSRARSALAGHAFTDFQTRISPLPGIAVSPV